MAAGAAARQLADGRSPTDYSPYPTIVADFLRYGSPPLAKIAAGSDFTCALTQAGGVRCWGANYYAQLGDGTIPAPGKHTDIPVSVVGLNSGVSGLVAGVSYACALTSAGGMKCWGHNTDGQLGDNTTTNRNTPVDVNGLSNSVVEIAAGGWHTCALTSAGGVKCWGNNGYGQLGNGTNPAHLIPVDVIGLSSGMIGLIAGENYTCALTSAGGVKCWGFNYMGQLGNSTNTSSNTPVNVSGLASGVIALSAGRDHTCALLSSGGVKCWGKNNYGQLGNAGNTNSNTPVNVYGLNSGVLGLTAGGDHTCALMTGGGVKCWGANGFGQLGDGTTISHNTPLGVNGLAAGVTLLTAGTFHTCAVLAGIGPLRCWGDNSYGQLGIGVATLPEELDTKGPVISKWLTADGLVEDEKGEVIIMPNPNTVLVIPPQPVVTPTVVTASEVVTPPTPCTNCSVLPGAPAVTVTVSTHVMITFHWVIHFPNWPQMNSLHSAASSDEQTLNMFHYVAGAWMPMLPCTGCTLDTTNHVMTATLDGPGMYALMAVRPPSFVYLPLVRR